MASSPFTAFLAERYHALKPLHPQEGRRKVMLRASQEFWNLSFEEKQRLSEQQPSVHQDIEAIEEDVDEFDTPSGIGIVVRTDYADENAWQTFCSRLREAEKEFVAGQIEEAESSPDVDMIENSAADATPSDDEGEDDEDDDSDDDDTSPPSIFALVDAPPNNRPALTHISNLSALRLFNDIGVTRAPGLPPGTKRVKPRNRLVDRDGFQEVYTGKLLWIYDARSNADQSVRLVNQRSNIYGTATGDSWRARVSFLPELQVNLYSGAMQIDFGGLDRWDQNERQRNLAEAETPIV